MVAGNLTPMQVNHDASNKLYSSDFVSEEMIPPYTIQHEDRQNNHDHNFTVSDEGWPLFMSHDEEDENDNNSLDENSPLISKTGKNNNKSIEEWAFMSYGITRSNSCLDKQNTIYSLKHRPSSDRRSNAYLMGVNLQSMILGTSVLGLPFCVKIAGVWSIFVLILVGLFSNFAAVILTDCQYQESFSSPRVMKRVYISFVEMAKISMDRLGAFVMKFLVYLSLLRNVVVVILLTDLSKDILLQFGISGYDKNLLAASWTIATIPLLFVTKVSYLAWVSFIGLNLYLVALATILVVSCTEYKSWNIREISWDFNIEGVGIATGIIINSYSVHMNMPALEASLKKPKKYKSATNITFVFNNISKIAFAICGYLTYVENTQQEITGNIVKFKPLPQIIRIAILFFTFFTVPLQSFVAFELIDDTFQNYFPMVNKKLWLLITRLMFMLLALFIAVMIPHFGLVVSLIGSIRGTMITLILPCTFYVLLKNHDIKLYKLVISYIIIIFGIFAGVLGVYSSVRVLAGKASI